MACRILHVSNPQHNGNTEMEVQAPKDVNGEDKVQVHFTGEPRHCTEVTPSAYHHTRHNHAFSASVTKWCTTCHDVCMLRRGQPVQGVDTPVNGWSRTHAIPSDPARGSPFGGDTLCPQCPGSVPKWRGARGARINISSASERGDDECTAQTQPHLLRTHLRTAPAERMAHPLCSRAHCTLCTGPSPSCIVVPSTKYQ